MRGLVQLGTIRHVQMPVVVKARGQTRARVAAKSRGAFLTSMSRSSAVEVDDLVSFLKALNGAPISPIELATPPLP